MHPRSATPSLTCLPTGWFSRRAPALWTCLALATATGCRPSQDSLPFVRLNNVATENADTDPDAVRYPLRLAVAPVLSPRASFGLYRQLAEYVAGRTGRKPQLLQRRSYREVNDLIRSGACDFAFVCDYGYLDGQREFGMQLLAVPFVGGKTEYYSYLIVPATSDARALPDLKGVVFAYSDPLSNSGWLVPVYQVLQLGERPDSFFRRTLFTHSHDNSIRAVADRLVDAAAVDSLVYDQMVRSDLEVTSRVRVIARWGPYGIPPVVCHPGIDEELRREILDALVSMHETDSGRKILAALGLSGFRPPDDSLYDGVREMMVEVERTCRP